MAFSQLIAFPQGVTETPVVAVPNGVQGCSITFTSNGWPAGDYFLEVMLSIDGGVTFPFIAGPMDMPSPPITFKGGPYSVQFQRGDAQPTHAKARITAPFAFSSTVTLAPF